MRNLLRVLLRYNCGERRRLLPGKWFPQKRCFLMQAIVPFLPESAFIAVLFGCDRSVKRHHLVVRSFARVYPTRADKIQPILRSSVLVETVKVYRARWCGNTSLQPPVSLYFYYTIFPSPYVKGDACKNRRVPCSGGCSKSQMSDNIILSDL